MEVTDDKGNIWQTFAIKGCRVFVRFKPFEDTGYFLETTVDIAVNRGDNWRVDIGKQYAISNHPGAARRIQTEIMRTAFALIRSLDDGRQIHPEGAYGPVIAELSALV